MSNSMIIILISIFVCGLFLLIRELKAVKVEALVKDVQFRYNATVRRDKFSKHGGKHKHRIVFVNYVYDGVQYNNIECRPLKFHVNIGEYVKIRILKKHPNYAIRQGLGIAMILGSIFSYWIIYFLI